MFRSLLKRKRKGSLTFWIYGMFFILFMYTLMSRELALQNLNVIKESVEDNLISSVLAACRLDKEGMALDSNVCISPDDSQPPIESFNLFKDLFGQNMDIGDILDDSTNSWHGNKNHYYLDFTENKKLDIIDYIVYNVPDSGDGYIAVYHKNEGALVGTWSMYSNVPEDDPLWITPEGTKVEKSSVYVQLRIPIDLGVLNIRNYVKKSQLVQLRRY